jgi:hypothetical protein
MEFFIKKGATLPVLKINVIKDGRSDYDRTMRFLEETDIFFSMVDTETGIPKFTTRPAGVMKKEQIDPTLEPEYYVYYQFTPKDTKSVGRYQGQFLFRNETGILTLPLNQNIFVNVTDSFIINDYEYQSCYVVDFPCCKSQPIPPPVPPSPPVTTTSTIAPTTTSTTSIPVTTTSTTLGPEPTGYTEWVVSFGSGAVNNACSQTGEYVTAYTPVMSALTIGQTLWASPSFNTYSFATNGGWFKVLKRNGLPYLPNTVVYVGAYSGLFGNYSQVIYSHECGTSFPCKCFTYTKTQNNVFNSIYVNCNGNSVAITLPFNGSQTFCAAFTQPYNYISVTGGNDNCVGGVCP